MAKVNPAQIRLRANRIAAPFREGQSIQWIESSGRTKGPYTVTWASEAASRGQQLIATAELHGYFHPHSPAWLFVEAQ